jgi:hypothetical protein
MTEAERLRTEIRDFEQKVADARRSAGPEAASNRSRSDLQMLEQELLALKQRPNHAPHGSKPFPADGSAADGMEWKLDSALSDSFPGSDAVSFLEPTPNKPTGLR